MKRESYEQRRSITISYFDKAHIILTQQEKERIEVADFGLNNIEKIGLQLITYINTERVCSKEMVLTPGQTCPEHKHVPTGGMPGKEETFRCRYGLVYLYVSGEGKREDVQVELPPTPVTVYHEIVLHPGEQYTIMPGTLHWFTGGPEGAVVSEFSTRSSDETDLFTDENVIREVRIED